MKKIFRYTWLLLFLLIAVFTVMIESEKSDYPGLLDVYYGIVYVACFLLSIPLIITWLNFYTKNKKWFNLLPISLPALLLMILIGINVYHSIRKNTPVLLDASQPGEGGISIELRTDKTYRIVSYGEFSTDSYYGDYTIKGDTLFLGENKSNLSFGKFLIKKETADTSRSKGQLIQISDRQSEYVTKLNIYVDKR